MIKRRHWLDQKTFLIIILDNCRDRCVKDVNILKLPKNGEWGSLRDVYHSEQSHLSSSKLSLSPNLLLHYTLSFIALFPIAHSLFQGTLSFSLSFLFQLRVLKILLPDTSPNNTRSPAIPSTPHF